MLEVDNHANQCNPNNDEYWHSRGNYQIKINKKNNEIHPTHYLNDIYNSLIKNKSPGFCCDPDKIIYCEYEKCYYTNIHNNNIKNYERISKKNKINIINYNISNLCNTNKSIKTIDLSSIKFNLRNLKDFTPGEISKYCDEEEINSYIKNKKMIDIITNKIKNNKNEYNLINNIIILKYYDTGDGNIIAILHNNVEDIYKIKKNILQGLEKLVSIEKNIINCWKFEDISLNLYNTIDRHRCQNYDDWDEPNDTCWHTKRHKLLEKYQGFNKISELFIDTKTRCGFSDRPNGIEYILDLCNKTWKNNNINYDYDYNSNYNSNIKELIEKLSLIYPINSLQNYNLYSKINPKILCGISNNKIYFINVLNKEILKQIDLNKTNKKITRACLLENNNILIEYNNSDLYEYNISENTLKSYTIENDYIPKKYDNKIIFEKLKKILYNSDLIESEDIQKYIPENMDLNSFIDLLQN